MAKWYAAKSIAKLREQINALFPNRDRKSDGIVGDLAHSNRKSSHNPDSRGAVRAFDVTHNPEQGLDCKTLLKTLLAEKDSRLWYIIFERKIYNRKDNFTPRPYSGANAHAHHLHISVSDDPALYDDGRDWNLGELTTGKRAESAESSPENTVEKKAPQTSPITLRLGDKGENVRALQNALVLRGFLDKKDIDAAFGKLTKSAVIAFQIKEGLRADGIVGENTRRALGI